jgi:long-chain acyl-CoA synthetase
MSGIPVESLLDFVKQYAAHGDEIAVRQRGGYRTESWAYGRMANEANRLSRELQSRGLAKGDTALLWAKNSAEWIVAFLGCLQCGIIVVPIDHTATHEFACRVCREAQAKLVFCAGGQEVSEGVPSLSLESMSRVTARHDTAPYQSPQLTRQDILEVIFTSGATAEPRGVVITHGNVLANIEPLQREIQKYLRYERLVHPLRFLNLLPLSHVFGQMLGIFIPQMLAGTVVFTDSLRPSEFTDTIRRERVSVVVTVPRFMESLEREIERFEEGEGGSEQFRKNFATAEHQHFLRRWWRFRRIHSLLGWKFWAFICGGAALPSPTETFWNRLGYAVIQGYGMTETTSLISLNHPFRSARGSIGRVFPGMEVRTDENGEILVRGENVATAYRQNGRNLTLAGSDGWFRTGDVAARDESGRLYFKGRQKNVIVTSAGMNVYPEDLEKALRGQPEVRDCVVIGIEQGGGEEPCAVLLMNGSAANPVAAVDQANQSLAGFQKINHWFVWPQGDFPRTPTHKPILPRIREAVTAARSGTREESRRPSALAGIIAQITGRPISMDSGDADLEKDLRLTSLDRVELMSVLEARHQVDLDDAQFQEVATIGQLEKLLAHGAPSPAQHAYPTWPQHPITTSIRLAVYYLLAWPATYLLAAPRIRGRENLRGLDGPVLVVSNHVTYLDIAWILPALPRRFRNRLATAMGGERLARMRRPSKALSPLERFMEGLRYVLVTSLFNVFPLPQRSGFLRSFRFAGDLVDRNWNVLVFPEGRTTADGELAPFRSGIGMLAKQLNIPVLPMRLDGLFPLKRDKRMWARPRQVRVAFGKPVRFSVTQDANEIAADLEKAVRELQSA